jgi:hypothetical protein
VRVGIVHRALGALAGCSETGTAARIPLGERLKKCFGILFGCTRMPRLDGAIAAKNHRYIRKAGPGRGIDRCLGPSGHFRYMGPHGSKWKAARLHVFDCREGW